MQEKLKYFSKIAYKNKLKIIGFVSLLSFLVVVSLLWAPKDFPVGKIFTVEQGQSIKIVADTLEEENLIQSSILFTTFNILSGSNVIQGDYLFYEKLNLFETISRIKKGSYQIPTKKVTLFEGMTVDEMAVILKARIENFDAKTFIEQATRYEGYLFPDTYEFRQNVKPETVIKILRENFDEHILELQEELNKSEFTLDQIVTMASIIEKEATHESRQEVSDILWGRIEIGMALQVDAPFVYYINKNSFELTTEDLRTDSPYNTYTNRGLTPTPIGNPGTDAILAAAFPQPTPYVYFLTGLDGEMYYAKTFEGHKRNKELYLR